MCFGSFRIWNMELSIKREHKFHGGSETPKNHLAGCFWRFFQRSLKTLSEKTRPGREDRPTWRASLQAEGMQEVLPCKFRTSTPESATYYACAQLTSKDVADKVG